MATDPGIILGKLDGEYVMQRGGLSAILTAPTRSGKGVGAAIPNCLSYPESMVANDIKDELFRLTSAYRAAHGQEVYRFAPFDETGRSHRWNPLDGLSDDERVRAAEVLSIAFTLYPDSSRDSSDIWQPTARNLFVGLVLYVLETPSAPSTIGEVLRQGSGKGQPLRDHVEGLVRERNYRPHVVGETEKGEPIIEYRRLVEWDGQGEPMLSVRCVDTLETFLGAKGNTSPSIGTTFTAPLTLWHSPIVDAATSATDFDVSAIRKRLMSIYIVITPDRLPESRVLLNLLWSRIITTNIREELRPERPRLRRLLDRLRGRIFGEPEPGERPPRSDVTRTCLLLMDEIAAIEFLPILDKGIGYIQGYGLRLLSICQSESQLRKDPPRGYGREGARTLMSNHAARVLYTPNEPEDAEEYSKALGFETVKARTTSHNAGRRQYTESEQRRALMLEQELRMMPADEQIILVGGTRPIKCERIRYYLDETFVGRMREVSPSLRALGKRLPVKAEIDAAMDLGELAVDVPRIDLDLHQATTERRVREMTPADVDGDVQLERVAADLGAVPALPDGPVDDADVDAIVDGFWSALGAAADIDTGTPDGWDADVDLDTGEWFGDVPDARPAPDLGALRAATAAEPAITERA